uniref:ZP domain-containing protein n=1 Tax=Acrobeloides nanus TaxID=290746 RepID=A0A914C3M0_9BILA
MIRLLSICLVLITPFCKAIPIDNGVEGEPEIECGPTSITVNFNTRNPFEGNVYVKGLFDHAECRSQEKGRQVAGIELPFDSCNVARTRSLNPRGVFVTANVVVSFHPLFVTKIDRAYRIQCFYMEADKTVSAQIEVSELTTAFVTQVVPMPICRYEILEGGPTGQPIRYATIGQQVYHKWTCDSETENTFCAVVHSCTVDDGNGDTVQILNEEGCALDKFLLNNLEYPTDLMAGQEAHVYKYADRAQLFYQCQISITIKEPNSECARPTCAEPTGFNAAQVGNKAGGEGAAATAAPAAPAPVRGSARRPAPAQLRLLKRESGFNQYDTLDVRAELNALDISNEDVSLPSQLKYRNEPVSLRAQTRNDICFSSYNLISFIMIGMSIVALLVVVASRSFHSGATKW